MFMLGWNFSQFSGKNMYHKKDCLRHFGNQFRVLFNLPTT